MCIVMKVTRKTTKGDISRAILSAVQVAGILSVGLVAPNVLGALSKLGILPSKFPNGIINRARNNLIKNGCLKRGAKGFLQLTEKGNKKLIKNLCEGYELTIPRIWNKKWHVIIFDVPEEKRELRDRLRYFLVTMGFIRLQASVWVFPYDCSEFISLLKADLKIGRDVLYMVVVSIECDDDLKESFGLKS